MKNILIYLAVALILLMLFLPLLSINGVSNALGDTQSPQNEQVTAKEGEVFSVLISQTGEVKEIPVKEYVFGVVAAEMNASFHSEALKAQAVAAYTYALRRKAENNDKSYDITDSPDTDQHYINESAAREKWGDKADEYSEKIKAAVAAVEGEYIACSGEPILALYHSCSAGKTEDIKDVFGSELPYLVSVDSLGDILSGEYSSECKFSNEEFKNLVGENADLSGEISSWVGETRHRENGYVESVLIGGKALSGVEIRKLFSLRSANFTIKYDNGFIFSVRGYGHGVGLSQTGAEYMACQGGTYKEILLWYYKDTEILKKN